RGIVNERQDQHQEGPFPGRGGAQVPAQAEAQRTDSSVRGGGDVGRKAEEVSRAFGTSTQYPVPSTLTTHKLARWFRCLVEAFTFSVHRRKPSPTATRNNRKSLSAWPSSCRLK